MPLYAVFTATGLIRGGNFSIFFVLLLGDARHSYKKTEEKEFQILLISTYPCITA